MKQNIRNQRNNGAIERIRREDLTGRDSTGEEQKMVGSLLAASSPLAKTPMSRIPIRTANAEKRARASNCLPPEYDESKLSPSEIRALRAQKRAAWRQARLKSLENDALQALIMIQTMSAAGQLDESTINASSASEGGAGGLPQEAEQPVGSSNASLPSPAQSPLPFEAASSPNSNDELGREPVSDDGHHEGRSSEEDGGDRLHQRFPRLAVKSRPGSEVVVRETEKVVEEKVTRRTEEAPGGGVRTVEYIEKVIETEVETMREKIIMFELEDSSSGDSERDGGKMDVNNGVTEPDGHHHRWVDGNETEQRREVESEEAAIAEPEPIQLQTIVEVINPMLTGDGQPNDIAIGRYSDVVYGEEDSLVAAPTTNAPVEYGRYAYEHGTYESINDKMKHVLRELKQNEKVRQNLSKSLTEDEIIALQAQEAEEAEDAELDDEEGDVPERYEEKTGAIGTVFMVRERLINDFYTHQSELAQEQQQQQRKYQQKLLDDNVSSAYRDCEVITNPNAERFSPAFDNHSGPGQLYHQTLHSEKIKAVFGSDDDEEEDDEKEGEEDEVDDQRNGNVAVGTVEPVTVRDSAAADDEDDDEGDEETVPSRVTGQTTNGSTETTTNTTTNNTVPSATNLATGGASNKRKKRKGKKKK